MFVRASLATFLLALATLPIAAQEVRNWPTPLFWSPEKAAKPASETVDPMSVAGAPPSPLPFVAITPCRLVDTRPSSSFPAGYGAPALVANATRDFDLNSAGHCPSIPADVGAYSLNVTVTETQGFGDIRIWPTGNFALVSTQNWQAAGVALANAAIVPAGTDGSITVQVAGSGTHLIIDINGYYGSNFDSLYINEGEESSISSVMIADGTIVNDDINASAAIADTKLATIATAGKVADTALSANVTKLGATIEASEITDITRSVSIPLLSFVDCDTGLAAFLDFSSGADRKADFIGVGSGAAGFRIFFDDDASQEDQDTEICSQLVMPLDYVSGGQFKFFVGKGGHAGETEILNCAVGRNSFLPPGYGTVTTTTDSTTSYTCVPTPQGLQAGDTLVIVLKVTSGTTIDDLVFLHSVAFEYTASQ